MREGPGSLDEMASESTNVLTVFGGAAAPLSRRKRDYFSLSLDGGNADARVHVQA